MGRPTFTWKTGDQEMATPKRVRTYRPKHSDSSLSREWRINMANKEKKILLLQFALSLAALTPGPSILREVRNFSSYK